MPKLTGETRTLTELQGARAPSAWPSDAATPGMSAGKYLGRYLVLYRIGSGGMGEVYAAYDPELDRKVAIKWVRSDLVTRLEETTRREAAALARLVHPNVVTVFDLGKADDRPFIAMEFVDGRTLKEWLADEAPDRQQILDAFLAAGRGLAAAHAAGLAHRDFKPSNVMISTEGEVKVLDFGLATEADGGGESDEATRWLGTPSYMAPERQEGHRGDALSDQYSFCAALYEALCDQAAKPTDGKPPRFSDERWGSRKGRALPRRVRRALARGLAQRPEDRFADLAELQQQLAPPRARRGFLAAVGVAMMSALLLIQGWLAGPRCDGGAEKLAGIWDVAQKRQIEDRFSASGAAFATGSWRAIEQALDRYTAAWQEMHMETCEATHHRGEQSASLLDRRMLCLDRRLQPLRALSQRLVDADVEVISRAGTAVAELESLGSCADPERLGQRRPMPEAPEVRARIVDLQQVAADQLAAFYLGQLPDLEALEDAAAQADEVGYPPLQGELKVVLGKLQDHFTQDASVAEANLMEALEQAIAGRDTSLQVRAYTELAETVGRRRPKDGQMWEELGRAALSASDGEHPELAFELETSAGLVDWSAGRRDQGGEHFAQALTWAEQAWHPDHPKLARAIGNLAIVGRGPGLERALAILEQASGPDNPWLASHLVNLAGGFAYRGAYDQALKHARRSERLIHDAYGHESRQRMIPLIMVAQLLMAADQPEEAEAALREALVLLPSNAPELRTVADVNIALARALHLQGRDREAWPFAEQALAVVEPGLAAEDPLSVEVWVVIGGVAREIGKLPKAAKYHDRARQALASAETHLQRTELLIQVAETQLTLEGAVDILPHLENALEEARPQIDRALTARLHFVMARAVNGRQPQRAQELANTALEVLTEESRLHQRWRQKIRTFLATALAAAGESAVQRRS